MVQKNQFQLELKRLQPQEKVQAMKVGSVTVESPEREQQVDRSVLGIETGFGASEPLEKSLAARERVDPQLRRQ